MNSLFRCLCVVGFSRLILWWLIVWLMMMFVLSSVVLLVSSVSVML